MTELPLWFGPAERPLFGWLSVPGPVVAALGVVLCPPLTEEARATHRTFRTLGERLAARGIVALRFDYYGTGDSAGSLTDPDLVAQWRRDVVLAAERVRMTGVPRIAAVGMRLGATLAAGAADEIELSDLVLWDPCASGMAFLREGRALHAVRSDPTAREADVPPDGAVDTPGFRFGPELAADLASVDLDGLATARYRPTRTLVLTRDDRPVPAVLRRSLDFAGVTWRNADGQAGLLDALPSAAVVPQRTLDDVVERLAEDAGAQHSVALDLRRRVEGSVHASDGTAVREVAARFTDIGLFGVMTERRGLRIERRRLPWVLFLNVASEHHIGPGRQWVELARDWAALGYRCLRLDQSGIGDSPTRAGQAPNVTFAPQWLDDVPAVVEELAVDGAPVVIVGLCSGAHSAMEAALLTRVDAILAVNVRMSTPQMSKGEPLFDARRKAARPPIGVIGRLAMRHRKLGGGVWRIYRQFAWWHAPLGAVAKVLATGTELVALANPVDAREFSEVIVWTLVGARRLRRNHRYRPIIDPGVDHSLLTQRGQQIVRTRFTQFLLERYGRASFDRYNHDRERALPNSGRPQPDTATELAPR